MLIKFIFIIISSVLIYSQEIKYLNSPGGGITALSVTNTNKVFAGEYSGSIFISEDGNTISKYIKVKSSSIRQILVNPNDNNYIYIQALDYKYKTTNMGDSWELIDYSLSRYGNCFAMNKQNPDCLYMIRNEKDIWKSYDKGANWFLLYSFENKLWSVAVSESDTMVLYASAEGKIHKSTNNGLNWFISNNSAEAYQIEINLKNPNSIYYSTDSGSFKSNESGANPFFLYNSLNFVIHPTDTLTIYGYYSALVGPGEILKTTDEGKTWQVLFSNWQMEQISPRSLAINPINPEIIYAGIGNLGIFKSENGGIDWFHTRLSNSNIIYYLEINKDKLSNIILGQYGWGIMKTINGGEDWFQAQFIPSNFYQLLECRDITYHPFDVNKGFLAARYWISKTYDGGKTWESLNMLYGINAVAYHPLNPDILIAGLTDLQLSGASYLYRSTNGGEDWYLIDILGPPFEAIQKFYFHPLNPDLIYGIGPRKIYVSTDAGETWANKVNGIIDDGIGNINLISDFVINNINPNIMYCTQRSAKDNKGHLYKSTNGGENWFAIDSSLHQINQHSRLSCIWLDPQNVKRLYVGVEDYIEINNGGLYLTEDEGKNWRRVYKGNVNSKYPRLIQSDNQTPHYIYFPTEFGIVKFLDTLTVTSVINSENEFVKEYYLAQNYPNPFNPSTKIKYSIPQSQLVQIKVYDILGREVKTLLNEYKQAGSYEVEFTAEALPSGVYFYKLQAGDFIATKKMILLH